MTQDPKRDFTVDWTSGNFDTWRRVIPAADVRSALEIGSWEGRSALFFLNHCPNCRVTCIDTFKGGREHHGMDALASIEARFDSNLAGYGSRVEKIKSRSVPALDRLGEEGRAFDLIYIDGSHARDDVVMDSFLAWRVLKQGGLLIWDDYRWAADVDVRESPQQAVDFFLAVYADELDILVATSQVIVRRLAPGKARTGTAGVVMHIARTPKNLFRFLLGRPIGHVSPR